MSDTFKYMLTDMLTCAHHCRRNIDPTTDTPFPCEGFNFRVGRKPTCEFFGINKESLMDTPPIHSQQLAFYFEKTCLRVRKQNYIAIYICLFIYNKDVECITLLKEMQIWKKLMKSTTTKAIAFPKIFKYRVRSSHIRYVDIVQQGRAANVLFTDEKIFTVNPACNSQNTRQLLRRGHQRSEKAPVNVELRWCSSKKVSKLPLDTTKAILLKFSTNLNWQTKIRVSVSLLNTGGLTYIFKAIIATNFFFDILIIRLFSRFHINEKCETLETELTRRIQMLWISTINKQKNRN
uniref:Apple domain-containing protein n=1 Tax=Heterorhabditis bacteriophora TaxID=37862 RepID=A0A1I7W9V9_HETBA